MLGGLLGGLGASLIVSHGFKGRGWGVVGGALLTICNVPCDSVKGGSGRASLDVCPLPWAPLWMDSEFSRADHTILPEPC